MATEKRLIDANKAQAVLVNMAEHLMEAGNPEMAGAVGYSAEIIGKQKTVDAVEVVFCDNCVNHGNCFPETTFRFAKIEKPYCCVGKMDGDGNG